MTFSWQWVTVADRPPLICNYLPGDGAGGTEANIGHYASAEECAQAVHNSYPVANGATYSASTPSTGACYAEYGMNHHIESSAWRRASLADGRRFHRRRRHPHRAPCATLV